MKAALTFVSLISGSLIFVNPAFVGRGGAR
jgi:hypothetical protein